MEAPTSNAPEIRDVRELHMQERFPKRKPKPWHRMALRIHITLNCTAFDICVNIVVVYL